jgi:CRISPR-associated protein Csm5
MNNVSIKLLSPVHVGSGRELQGNAECLFFNEQRKLGVVDDEKVFAIIGEANIDKWVEYIENPESSFVDYLRMRKRDLSAEDVSSRVLPLAGTIFPKVHHPLREQIRTGTMPYIPGSSIKGAIRTALFGTAMRNKTSTIPLSKLKNFRGKFSSTQVLEKEVFGNDPNHDWLRLLRVSDFIFPENTTRAAFSESINEFKEDQYRMKDEIKVLIEYLPSSLNSNGSIDIAKDLQREAGARRLFDKKPLGQNSEIDTASFSLIDVFKVVNQHSAHLLEAELSRFEPAEIPENADGYVESLESMLAEVSYCAANECILRLGFGTGYRNMTGDWVCEERLLDYETYNEIAIAARRTERYEGFQLPKTRRVMLGGIPLGYVKLIHNL